MTGEEWGRIEAVFAAALELPAGERARFLDEQCAGDAVLRTEVESLLAEHDSAPGFLDAPPVWLAETETVPERIGNYRIVRLIGRGGMGTVYLAEREAQQFRQLVALKVMRRGLDTDDLIARFRNERQILARLEHPNIARLLDVGATEQGLPFFVMEHVDGVPLLEYCRQGAVPLVPRIRLFQAICDAVHYAHRRLIVHRDLKPGNILVTREGVPKLLDFGIAKILDPEPDGVISGLTRADARLLTPEYAAPEQLRGDAITTASDVYVLGVLLRELLADVPAHHDLHTIALKAVRAEPEERYASALSLSEDLGRHLDGLPVHARPATIRYRTRKFVARNRVLVAAAVLLFVVLTASTGVTTYQARRIDQEAARVTRERDKALQVKNFLLEMFGTTGPDQPTGDSVTARQLLDRRASTLEQAYGADPEMRAEMMAVLAEGYEKLGLFSRAEEYARSALELRLSLHGESHADVATSLNVLGWLVRETGSLEEADSLLRRAVAVGRSVYPPSGDAGLARALNDLGVVREARGDYDEAAALYTESLEMRRRLLGDQHVGVAITTSNLAVVLYRRGDLDSAVTVASRALELFRSVLGPDHQRTTIVQSNLAAMQSRQGDHAAAARQHADILARRQRLFGAAHPSVAFSTVMLANELIGAKQYTGVDTMLDAALASLRRIHGAGHENVANALRVRGDLWLETNRPEQALADYEASLASHRASQGARHPIVALMLARVASARQALGELDRAERLYLEAASLSAAVNGARHAQTLEIETQLRELRAARAPIR